MLRGVKNWLQKDQKIYAYLTIVAISIFYIPRTISRGADFPCFYNTGKLWLQQESLYFTSEKSNICESPQKAPEDMNYSHRTGFYYMPLSAIFFLPFHVFDYETAIALWTLLNIWLIYLMTTVSFKCLPWRLSRKKRYGIIAFVLLVFFNTLQDNLDFAQTSIFTFVFMLMGYFSFTNNRFISTGFFLRLRLL